MTCVTFLTDFGLRDAYVGMMKGVVLSRAPHVAMVDISHQLPKFSIRAAAHCVAQGYWRYFPKGSIHVVVVDPGVGGARLPVVIVAEGHYFVGPNNGLFSGLSTIATSCRSLQDTPVQLEDPSATFHGRDMFAPVAAALACGIPVENLSGATASLVLLSQDLPHLANGVLSGRFANADDFGNVMTTISRADIARLGELPLGRLSLDVPGVDTPLPHDISRTYEDVAAGEALWLINSAGVLELAVNQGSAQDRFGKLLLDKHIDIRMRI